MQKLAVEDNETIEAACLNDNIAWYCVFTCRICRGAPSSSPLAMSSVSPSASSPCGDKKKGAKIDYIRATYDKNDNIKPYSEWRIRYNKGCKKLVQEDHKTLTAVCLEDNIAKVCGDTCGRCPV